MMKQKKLNIMLFVLLVSVILFELPVNAQSSFTATAECIQGQQVKICISMEKDSSIAGIDIFRADQPEAEYQLVGTLDFQENGFEAYLDDGAWYDYYWNDKLSLQYIDGQSFILYQTYYYQVKSYQMNENGEKVYLDSVDMSVTILADGPQITSGKRSGKDKAIIKWSRIEDVDGYLIYCVQNYDAKSNYVNVNVDDLDTYKLVKSVKGNTTCSATFKKLRNGVTYTYRVYAYKNINGEKVFTLPSNYKSVLMNYYSYDMEPYSKRIKRAFGSEKKRQSNFKTASKASKQMKRIKIKVWDFKNGKNGKKVTRTKWLTVNKGLAPSVKAMFDEIYKSKEKQVIHDIGCYSYRTGEHMYGLAIDINPNENYMIDGKRVIAGSFWKPKKNKYSIPLNCEFVNIMQRYGFYRGFWGQRKDYMHFSYFGT